MKTCIPLLYLMATIVSAARVERITIDLERPKQPFTLQLTSSTDTEVQAALFASGSEFNPEGWQSILWYGDVSGGIAITNTASMWGIMSWDVTADLLPTNGRYSVQVLGARGGRLEEWATGILQVRGGLGSTMPPDWTTAGPAYDIATNALAKAELAESWGDHGQAGYATQGWVIERIGEVVETDPVATPLINTHTANAAIHLTPEQSGRIAGAILGSQIPEYLRSLPAVTNWSFVVSGGDKSMSFNSQTGLLFSDGAESTSYFLNCFGFTMLSDNGGGNVSFRLDGLRVNDTLYGYPSGVASDIATKADIASAVAGLDPEEHDPAYWREYYYGDPNIMPSPTNWFTYAAIDGGAAWAITGFDPPLLADTGSIVVPYEFTGKPVREIGKNAFRDNERDIDKIFAGVSVVEEYAFWAQNFREMTLLRCQVVDGAAFYKCSELVSIKLPQCHTFVMGCFMLSDNLTNIVLGATVPTIGANTFLGTSANLKITVLDPQADYPATLTDGAKTVPVVRIVNTEMLADFIPDVDTSSLVKNQNGTATNLMTRGWLELPQSAATNLFLRIVSSNEHIYVEEVWK